MTTKTFTVGRITRATYREGERALELVFTNGTVKTYRHVPAEVFARFCNAPNPTTFWEDRIAEEYPSGTSKESGSAQSARSRLDDLFG